MKDANEERTLQVDRSTSTAHKLEHYDGVCGNIHGHNLDWHVEAVVSMVGTDEGNMPVDLKDVADVLDTVDHACILNDDIVEEVLEHRAIDDEAERIDAEDLIEWFFGDVIWFESDPTCEVLSQWMANRLVQEFDAIRYASITVNETDKYGIHTAAHSEVSEDGE